MKPKFPTISLFGVICLLAAFVSPLLLAPVDASEASGHRMPEQTVSEPEETAPEWLARLRSNLVADARDGLTIYWVGYVPADELTPDRLAELQSSDLRPGFLSIDPAKAVRLPIEIFEFSSEGPNPQRCLALLQVVMDSPHPAISEEAQRDMNFYRTKVPDHPLDQDCKYLRPWPVSGKERMRVPIVGTVEGPGLYYQGRLVRITHGLRCGDYDRRQNGPIAISASTKYVISGQINDFTLNSYPMPVEPHAVSMFEHGFDSVLKQQGKPRAHFMVDDYLLPSKDIVRVYLAMIDDPDTDQFCLATVFRQGNSRWSRIKTFPKSGRFAPWMDAPDDNTGVWKVRQDVKEFGTEVATEFLAAQEVYSRMRR